MNTNDKGGRLRGGGRKCIPPFPPSLFMVPSDVRCQGTNEGKWHTRLKGGNKERNPLLQELRIFCLMGNWFKLLLFFNIIAKLII